MTDEFDFTCTDLEPGTAEYQNAVNTALQEIVSDHNSSFSLFMLNEGGLSDWRDRFVQHYGIKPMSKRFANGTHGVVVSYSVPRLTVVNAFEHDRLAFGSVTREIPADPQWIQMIQQYLMDYYSNYTSATGAPVEFYEFEPRLVLDCDKWDQHWISMLVYFNMGNVQPKYFATGELPEHDELLPLHDSWSADDCVVFEIRDNQVKHMGDLPVALVYKSE